MLTKELVLFPPMLAFTAGEGTYIAQENKSFPHRITDDYLLGTCAPSCACARAHGAACTPAMFSPLLRFDFISASRVCSLASAETS